MQSLPHSPSLHNCLSAGVHGLTYTVKLSKLKWWVGLVDPEVSLTLVAVERLKYFAVRLQLATDQLVLAHFGEGHTSWEAQTLPVQHIPVCMLSRL